MRKWVLACVAPVVAVLVLAGCAGTRPVHEGPRQYLDETTAATVTVQGRPLVFARERRELAVHARDYVTLLPVDVNRSGAHAQYFYGYVWSTIDKSRAGEGGEAPTRFELIADGRRIPLVPLTGEPRTLGLAQAPLPAPTASAQVMVMVTSHEVQEFVLRADEVDAVAFRDGSAEPFLLWAR